MRVLIALMMILAGAYCQSAVAVSAVPDLPIGQPSILPVDSRCSVSTGASVMDYGSSSRWQLQDTAGTRGVLTLGKRTVTVNVICPYSQMMRLTLRGQPGTEGKLRYGDRGLVSIELQEAQLDGQAVLISTTSIDGVVNGAPAMKRAVQPGQTLTAMSGGAVAKGRNLTLRLEIEPMLPEEEARVSSRQVSEAQFTLELLK